MDDDLLNDVAKILSVHQDETIKSNQRVDDLKYTIPTIDASLSAQSQTQRDLQNLLNELDLSLADSNQLNKVDKLVDDLGDILTTSVKSSSTQQFNKLDNLHALTDWHSLVQQTENYGNRHHLDLSNPYFTMMSQYEFSQQITTLENSFNLSHLQKSDYIFSSVVGIITSLIDVLFVGRIHTGTSTQGLQQIVDNKYESIVVTVGKFTRKSELTTQLKNFKKSIKGTPTKAQLKRLEKFHERIQRVDESNKKQSIHTLEKHFKVSYDAANNASIVEGYVSKMDANNHHLRSLAHDPGILGLIVGIIDQLTNKASFIDGDGKIIRVVTKNVENTTVSQGPLPFKIIKATENWFGHLLSDVSGSSGAKGRGAGLPIPFYSVTQKLNFGSIPIKNNNFTVAQTSEWLYKQGTDLRAFTAQSIPVLIGETLIRLYWFTKQRFYLGLPAKDSIPIANNPDLNKLLLTNTAVFASVDFGDAALRSEGCQNIPELLLRLNYANLVDLGFRSIQALRFQVKHLQEVDKIDEDIQQEWNHILIS
ncbi:hypothetical protein [Levilactobacillus parabrevis]|uniref:hypothetical protein n=1 Tax=Levilactobacillus parabrevis TaxID=357278 RepID=UPI0037578E95